MSKRVTMSKFKGTPGPWSRVNGYNIFSDLGADSGDGYKAPGNDGWLIATATERDIFEIARAAHRKGAQQ